MEESLRKPKINGRKPNSLSSLVSCGVQTSNSWYEKQRMRCYQVRIFKIVCNRTQLKILTGARVDKNEVQEAVIAGCNNSILSKMFCSFHRFGRRKARG